MEDIIMKLNFSMIKNENIGFKYSQNGKRYSFRGKLLNVKQTKSQYEFFYEDNRIVTAF